MSTLEASPTQDSDSRGGLGPDLLASVVVFLVALPLCLGIAIASGVPVGRGLVSGMIGGLVVGFFSGCPLQASGPAAGLAVMVWDFVTKHGLGALGPVILGAGVVQIVAGLAGVGRYFRAVSPAVIHGMLAGIGALIFAGQFHVMVDDVPRGSGIANLLSIPEAIYKGMIPVEGTAHHLAAFVGLATIAVMVIHHNFRPKWVSWLPAPLFGVAVGTILAQGLGLGIQYVKVPPNLGDAVALISPSDLGMLADTKLLIAALAFALVASAETLLCAAAVDQMQAGQRTDYDRELFAQGVGNSLAGVLGCLPITGVIVRSTANIEAGAKTRASTMFHGLWLLVLVAAVPQLLELIPRSSLAAVLVFTGYRLMNPNPVRIIAKFGRSELGIYLVTVFGIVAFDLLTGVVLGFVLSLAKLLIKFSDLDIAVSRPADGNRHKVALKGVATFVGLPKLARELEGLPSDAEVELEHRDLVFIDHACLDLLAAWEKRHNANGGKAHVDWAELSEISDHTGTFKSGGGGH